MTVHRRLDDRPWPAVATVGHNGGPPLDEPVNDLFVSYRWRKARREAFKNPPRSIMLFRLSRARAAGVTYHEYVLALLDTGRHLQAGDAAVDEAAPASTGVLGKARG